MRLASLVAGCPHAAIREDISANLHAAQLLTASIPNLQLTLLESGGDNLAASYSSELADYTFYVIDVAGGDKVPRKGGPGGTYERSDSEERSDEDVLLERVH